MRNYCVKKKNHKKQIQLWINRCLWSMKCLAYTVIYLVCSVLQESRQMTRWAGTDLANLWNWQYTVLWMWHETTVRFTRHFTVKLTWNHTMKMVWNLCCKINCTVKWAWKYCAIEMKLDCELETTQSNWHETIVNLKLFS